MKVVDEQHSTDGQFEHAEHAEHAKHVEYAEFIAGKIARVQPAGFDWPAESLPAAMFDWQKRGCLLALKRGRCALFLNTGLGKTLVQLAWASAVAEHTGRPVLLLCPLAVGPQTVREADKFGIAGVSLFEPAKGIDPAARVVVTNYQKLHLIDPSAFAGVVLDESSILKSFTGTTKRQLCEAFAATPYRLACTATPSPNDHMELGNHSQFLGVMDSTEMLTRWFINDLSQAGVYRIKGHAEADFWRWVCSWAVFAAVPSDLGGDDSTHALPPLELVRHEVAEDQAGGDGQLFRSDAVTATTIHKQKRETIGERAKKVAEVIAADAGRPWLVWCDTDYEADALLAAIPGSVDVRGSQTDAVKEDRLAGFVDGRYRTLIGKPSQLGFGLNWQHCCRMAFAGLSFSFEQYYQAVRRCWRFGQTQAVQVHVVCSASEWQIVSTVERKQADFEAMQAGMRAAARSAFADDTGGSLALADTTSGEVRAGKRWTLVNDDCVKAVGRLPEKTVGFSIHSPPFSNLYIYSDSQFDMGNSANHEEFFRHYGYLVPALLKATIPGRLAAVHCKDLPLYMNRDGVAGLYPFPDEITRLFVSHGWTFHSRVTIWKCPVTEMERTKNHGLLHKTVKADSSAVRQGMADYLLVFRRPPTEGLLSDSPVSRPTGLTEWHGDPELDPRVNDVHPSKYARKGKRSKGDDETNDSIRIWQRMADPVWWHIDQQDVLNKDLAKSDKDEKHICLARGSLVLTSTGHKPIQDVAVGDMVLTHMGRWRPVRAVRMTGVRPCVRLKAQGVADLVLTPEHKVWTRRAGATTRVREEAAAGTPEWVRADGTVGSYVNQKLPPQGDSPDLSAREWWLVGRWIADGHKGVRGDYHVSVGRDKLAEFLYMAGENAGMRHEVTAVQVRLKGLRPEVLEVLSQCGEGAAGKRIPASGLALPPSVAAHLLAGYLSGDGHKVPGRERWMATSVSRELLLGVSMLAQRVWGVVASINAGRKPGTTVIEGREVNTRQEWVISFDLPHGRRKKPFVMDDGAWKKVRTVADAGEQETWCLQVEEDESFTAEGCVVKNCPLQLGVIRESVGLWTLPGDLVIDPFNGIGSTGVVAMEMGRRYWGSELKPSYFEISARNLANAERRANESGRTLFDAEHNEIDDGDTASTPAATPAKPAKPTRRRKPTTTPATTPAAADSPAVESPGATAATATATQEAA